MGSLKACAASVGQKLTLAENSPAKVTNTPRTIKISWVALAVLAVVFGIVAGVAFAKAWPAAAQYTLAAGAGAIAAIILLQYAIQCNQQCKINVEMEKISSDTAGAV